MPGAAAAADAVEGRGGRFPRGGLTTTGVGTVLVVPDVVVVRLAAQASDEDPQRAQAAVTAGADALRDALLAAGVAPPDLRTSATTSWTDPGQVVESGDGTREVHLPRTTASLALDATLRDTSTAGAVTAAALAAAGPVGRLERTTFEVGDPGPASRHARELAFAAAVEAARQLAALAGRPLGPVLDVREEHAGAAPVAMAFMARASADVPLEGGSQEVRVTLVVRHGWAVDAPG